MCAEYVVLAVFGIVREADSSSGSEGVDGVSNTVTFLQSGRNVGGDGSQSVCSYIKTDNMGSRTCLYCV